MTTAWNLAELKEYIHNDRSEHHQLIAVADSIGRSTDIFRYHLLTARDALKNFIDIDNPNNLKNMEMFFGLHEDHEKFLYAKIASEANIIACIHAVRSMLDIFSHLINGLILEKPLSVDKCDIKKVYSHLPSSNLKNLLEQLFNSYWFKYMDGFINTSKHRKLIQHELSLSFPENTIGIHIGEFMYNKNLYPNHWGNVVLEGMVEVNNYILDCGRALNHQCISANA